jgi:hypothetical protein
MIVLTAPIHITRTKKVIKSILVCTENLSSGVVVVKSAQDGV